MPHGTPAHNTLIIERKLALRTDEDALPGNSPGRGIALQVCPDVFLEMIARLLAGCCIEKEGQFAPALLRHAQRDPAASSHIGDKLNGILPERLFMEDTAMGKPHGKRGVDIEHWPLEGEDDGFAWRVQGAYIAAHYL